MKKLLTLLSFIPALLWASKPPTTVKLNNDWQFTQTNKNEWRSATVPGSVQRDLIRLEELPNPYFGTNEDSVQWVEDENWDFKKSFKLTKEHLNYDDALLTFEGLDTHADVFLNGSKLFHAENMFVKHEQSVKELLKEGENHLYIRFYSPIEHMMPARLTNGFEYPVGNDARDEKMSIYSRKAPYHYGWDWGMRLVQMGIWRPVYLTLYNKLRIDDFFVQQESVSEDIAQITNYVEVYSLAENANNAKVIVSYDLPNHKLSDANNLTLQLSLIDFKGEVIKYIETKGRC